VGGFLPVPLGIDPTVDYAFKKLFGDPANSDLLIHLLNAVLTPASPIVEVQILNPFNEKEFADDKLSVLDLKARDAHRAWFNVEMQSKALGWLRQRIVYYNSSLFVDQLGEGEHYHTLLPAISICFLKEPLFPQVAAPHLRFGLNDCEHGVRLCDSLEIHTIELPKYNYDSSALSAAAALTQWAFFLDRAAELEVPELKRLLPAREYAKATEIMETIARTPQERQLYESRRKAEMDYRAGLDEALAVGMEKGERLGLEKGERLGLEKGERLGLEKGERRALQDQVHFLQGLLQEPLSAQAVLQTMDIAALRRLCGELQDRLRRAR
jgi:predicted transposase/invertase (TIGR01784 family)